MDRVLFHKATVLTMDRERSVLRDADVLVEGSHIAAVGPSGSVPADDALRIDAAERLLLPGFVQTHVHLCQTLFRGLADDLALLDWLRLRIWPMEAAHDEESLRCSALLGIAELLRSGTTTILDMATAHHTEAVFQALEETGLRAISGACMMDDGDIPDGLRLSTAAALDQSQRLLADWHGRAGGRLRYGFAPRFVLCCSERLLREVARLAEDYGVHVHTHAAENRSEMDLVRERCGAGNVSYFRRIGLLGPRTVLAHCIWLEDGEYGDLRQTETAVAHCPSSNLKLGSGVADVPRMLGSGIRVGIGADGAPCNNTLDVFAEMRAAALIQKPLHGPASFTAQEVLELATIGGATALGLGQEIGSVEAGKRADLQLLDLRRLHSWPQVAPSNPFSAVVYCGRPENVELVMVDGRILYQGGGFASLDARALLRDSRRALERLLERL